jgi:hypothetical protein
MDEKIESSSKKIKGISSFAKNRTNPFFDQALDNISIVKKKQWISSTKNAEVHTIIDKSGEAVGHTAFMRFIEVDEEKFAKMYLSQFENFWDLPKSAIRVFGYIMKQLQPKKDKFEFFYDECQEYTKYNSLQPIYNGLTGLISNGIIARGYNENTFFINPLIVFNGDRVTFAKTYIKKKKNNPDQMTLFIDNSSEEPNPITDQL